MAQVDANSHCGDNVAIAKRRILLRLKTKISNKMQVALAREF
ncbi:MAG: hypothetical protein AAFQ80_23170 [Cyanobacteria bacterium J06621_8]